MNNTLGTAVQDTIVTDGAAHLNNETGKYFRKLPKFLVGANYFQMPNLNISNDLIMNITIYRPSTIYIAMDSNDEQFALSSNGWTQEDEKHSVQLLKTKSVNLTSIFNKTFSNHGRTSISLPFDEFANEFRAVVFVVGNGLNYHNSNI